MAQESAVCDLSIFDTVDDLYFSALFEENQENIFPLSDAKYAEELQFQEAIMASTINFPITTGSSSSSSKSTTLQSLPLMVIQADDDHQKIQMLDSVGSMEMSIVEAGESSQNFCEICAERKESDEMFKTESCVHSYCCDCISKHVATKLQHNILTLTCPGLDCKSVLEFDACIPVLPKGVVELWAELLCEEMIDASQRFYCPFKDCSALLVIEIDGEVIRSSECPFCHRLFCAQCYVPWHCGIECEEFQRLNPDEKGREDLMLRELANEKKWGRCPMCKFYVERTEGCPHMTCRCKFQFCYGCGSEWTASHGGCHRQ